MNIALIFDSDINLGGGFQYQLSTAIELKQLKQHNFIPIVFSESNKQILLEHGISSTLVKRKINDYIFRLIYQLDVLRWSFPALKTSFERKLDELDIDLVFFMAPSLLLIDLMTHNYCVSLWDLCHRDNPEFPEMQRQGEFEKREYIYSRCLKKAVAIFTDSEIGRQNALRRYNLDPERVISVPFVPSVHSKISPYIDIKSKYGIVGEYVYYPAQFWPHKNHVYVIDALAILHKRNVHVNAIFSGSDQGNLKHVLDYAKACQVDDRVKYIGFAPDTEIYQLYKQAIALVMPSYFGPTNIPPLEAFSIGTPVIYSEIDSFRQQVGNAALLCDLQNPDILSNHIEDLLHSETLRNDLIQKGYHRLKELNSVSIAKVMDNILDKYSRILKCWKTDSPKNLEQSQD